MSERSTERVRRVVVPAQEEARHLNHNYTGNYTGTEHILLGLVRESEGVAARVLSNLDIDPKEVGREVVRRLGGGRAYPMGGGARRVAFRRPVGPLELYARSARSEESVAERFLLRPLLADSDCPYVARGGRALSSGPERNGGLLEGNARAPDLKAESGPASERGTRRVGGRVFEESEASPTVRELRVGVTPPRGAGVRRCSESPANGTFRR